MDPFPESTVLTTGQGRRRLVPDVRDVGAWGTALLVGSTVLAVLLRWPSQFGGAGDPDAVLSEAFSRGTALSPPLTLVPLFAFATWLAARGGRVRWTGGTLLVLLALVFVLGGLGEAFAPATADVPRAALVASGTIAVGLALVVVVAVVRRLRVRDDARARQGSRRG